MSRIANPTAVALAGAANAAGYAPSIHNTQPWHWRVRPDRLLLFADRSRQLAATDPDGMLLVLSCGAALQHARLALLAEGWTTEVRYLPDPAQPDLLAEIVAADRSEPTAQAMRMVQAMRVRHTDRRPLSEQALSPDTTAALLGAASGLARLHVLTADQVLELAAAAHRAAEIEADDPQIRAELAYWTSRSGLDGTGLPHDVLPAHPPQTTVPGRDFGAPGTLPIGPGHDRQARYALLYGDDDEPDSWLRAGAALTAVWLTAVGLGVSVVPLSGVVEVAATRETLREMLAGVGRPYLVLRLGITDRAHAGPPHTPRLPADQTVDLSAVDGDS
ncbi:nitroreductase family protein [Asanoa sp. NPDC049518]|uniref:Acg family FMN-binding oxidoreductase n=1 Tax=unclassified Asanoa TaxID=2685164 RepID=UPI00343D37ED